MPTLPANPGNLVVPLSAIIDQLEGKLSAADINALLLSVVNQQRQEVRPGDLITSDLINQLISDIADLNQRVSMLQGTTTVSLIQIYRVDGQAPIRVGSRVVVTGTNFSSPGSRNAIAVNAASAAAIDNGSSPSQLVFDVPDPGIGSASQLVTLTVTNASGQSGTLPFQLAPALTVPTGTLALNYVNPPPNSTNTNLQPGQYDFGYKLSASVDQNAQVQVTATPSDTSWTVSLIDQQTLTPLSQPLLLQHAAGTYFERFFLVRIVAPSAATATQSATITIGATELTVGTQVAPAIPLQLKLAINQPVPQPDNRVAVNLLPSSQGVTFNGSTAFFSRNTCGQIDFGIVISGLTAAANVVTAFALSAAFDPPGTTSWTFKVAGGLGQSTLNITGTGGSGSTSAFIQPPNAASAAALLLTITGSPTGQPPVNVTVRIPLQTN